MSKFCISVTLDWRCICRLICDSTPSEDSGSQRYVVMTRREHCRHRRQQSGRTGNRGCCMITMSTPLESYRDRRRQAHGHLRPAAEAQSGDGPASSVASRHLYARAAGRWTPWDGVTLENLGRNSDVTRLRNGGVLRAAHAGICGYRGSGCRSAVCRPPNTAVRGICQGPNTPPRWRPAQSSPNSPHRN